MPARGYVTAPTPNYSGLGTSIAIDAVQRRLNLTVLVGTKGYPMSIRLESRDAPCYVAQGAVGVLLNVAPASNERLLQEQWLEIDVRSAADAYVAVQRSSDLDGVLAAVRTDVIP